MTTFSTIVEYRHASYDRYGLLFTEAIGVRLSPEGSTLPLFYGEVKIDAGNQYHPVPRTRSSEE